MDKPTEQPLHPNYECSDDGCNCHWPNIRQPLSEQPPERIKLTEITDEQFIADVKADPRLCESNYDRVIHDYLDTPTYIRNRIKTSQLKADEAKLPDIVDAALAKLQEQVKP